MKAFEVGTDWKSLNLLLNCEILVKKDLLILVQVAEKQCEMITVMPKVRALQQIVSTRS